MDIRQEVLGAGSDWDTQRVKTGPRKKHPQNPIFRRAYTFWEKEIVSACQIFPMDGYYYMFYIGFEDMYKATINVARSKDGIEGWERYPHNPILSGGPEGSWDVEAVYKPWVMHMDGQWLLWANGRRAAVEQVGLYIHDGDNMFEDWND